MRAKVAKRLRTKSKELASEYMTDWKTSYKKAKRLHNSLPSTQRGLSTKVNHAHVG